MNLSPILNKIILESKRIAKEYRHQFLTPEHVLAVSLNESFVEQLLSDSGSNTKELKKQVINYLETKMPVISENANEEFIKNPIGSTLYNSIIQTAADHCFFCKSDIIDITDILVCMYDEGRIYSSYFLKKSGVERLRLVENIARLRFINKQYSSRLASSQNPFVIPGEIAGTNNSGGLRRFAINMTDLAKKGAYDTLVGREEEIERSIQVLCRRTKNNPLHVGDAGVGKTAITQGLAQRIVAGRVPSILKGYSIYSLDIGLLLAGAKFRGDFEERLHSIIDELKETKNSILFIDEIHMIMGAGNNGNSQIDVANMLKPVLASGEVKVIGSTTFEEYSRNFEKDRALARRFQKIDIKEPSYQETINIIKGLCSKYEQHHNVKYSMGAIEEAVKLSIQFMPDKRLPDKAIDIIDEAGAYMHIRRAGGFYGINSQADNNEDTAGTAIAAVAKDRKSGKRNSTVSLDIIRKITADMVKLPIDTVRNNEKEILKNLDDSIKKVIYGQDNAVTVLSKAVKRARAGFRNHDKPEACYLFVGPTGCGKTELAKTLSELLQEPLLRYDMSEYQEKHTVSRLVGSPPGYVGFEEGGLLTKDVRKHPHSIILFDEIEKAHEDIYNVLLQIMDYGQLTDNQGRKADFRSCIIIMTSNAGARELEKGGIGFGTESEKDVEASLQEAVTKEFPPEFRNRLNAVIPFSYLDIDVAKMVCRKEVSYISKMMAEKKVTLTVTEDCIDFLTSKGYSKEFGARNIARTVEREISDQLVDEVLFGSLEKGGNVKADAKDNKIIFDFS